MFSRDFLTRMAQQYQLTPEQQDVFLLRFSSERKSYQEIAEILETSVDGIYKRASLIYEKFKIEGENRGKENRLRRKLRELQSPNLNVSVDYPEQQQDPNVQQNSTKLQYIPKNVTSLPAKSPESFFDNETRFDELAIALQESSESYLDQGSQGTTALMPSAIAQVVVASQQNKPEITLNFMPVIAQIAAISQGNRIEIIKDLLRVIFSELENAAIKSAIDQADILANADNQETKIQAVKDYTRAIATNTNYAPAHYKRGLARVTEGVKNSLKDLEKALSLYLL